MPSKIIGDKGSGKLASGAKVPSEFGRLVKELRVKRGISQATLAKGAQISPGFVGLWEAGDRAGGSLEIVKRVGQALGCNLEDTERLLRAAGHLGEGETLLEVERPTFAQFIGRDPRLTRVQKNALIVTYDAFVGRR